MSVKYLLAITTSAVGCSLRTQLCEALYGSSCSLRVREPEAEGECRAGSALADGHHHSGRAPELSAVIGSMDSPRQGKRCAKARVHAGSPVSGGSEGTETKPGLETWLQHTYEKFIQDTSNMQHGPTSIQGLSWRLALLQHPWGRD